MANCGVAGRVNPVADQDQFSDVGDAASRPEISAVNLLWRILAHPVPTLGHLRDHSQRVWLVPVILGILLVAAQALVTVPIAGRSAGERLEVQPAQMPTQQGTDMSTRIIRGASLVLLVATALLSGLIGLWVRWAFRAAAVHVFSLGLGGRNRFDQVFTMVVWTWVPLLMRSLLQTLDIAFSGVLPTHRGLAAYPAALGQPLPSGVQYALLSQAQIDLFALWNLMLLAAGVLIVTDLSRVRALLVTVGYWALATALSLIPAVAGDLVLSRFPLLRGPGA